MCNFVSSKLIVGYKVYFFILMHTCNKRIEWLATIWTVIKDVASLSFFLKRVILHPKRPQKQIICL